ncbi:hypothetical protein BSL78_25240 [Apostichopus japonicus]|uniref:Reverse transcriptase domain-containing protein n=1 Tax=Stichopus japonicus TaxID=307972 RepID=A0A2G8JQ63_STIJA|nr:hypothetical protein BSL78_25240 [Apostichopus japonicus]
MPEPSASTRTLKQDRTGKLGTPRTKSQELGAISRSEGSMVASPVIVGRSPTTTVRMHGVNFEATVDTGSDVTTMTEECFRRSFSSVPLEQLSWLTITAANGGDLPYVGYFVADIHIVRVTKDVPMLLGMNVLKELSPEVLVNKLMISKEKLLVDTPPTKVIQGLVRVAGRNKVRIAARSIMAVEVTCPVVPTWKEVILEPVKELPKGVSVGATLAFAPRGKSCLQVLNLTDEEVWLRPRNHLVNYKGFPGLKMQLSYLKAVKPSSKTPEMFNVPNLLWPGLSDDQLRQAKCLLMKNQDVFASTDYDLGVTNTIRHTIPTVDDEPVKQTYRRIPPCQFEEVQEHVRKLLAKGVIKPSTSPYASPVVLVRKTDGTLRLCVDYRKLNGKTRKDAYPLPRIQESLDALTNAKWFSTIDLISGYHQVEMAEEDAQKTAFITPFGLYQYVRMPFGLCNAPGTFQRLMQACLGDQYFQSLLCYLDDILVYSSTFEDHLERLNLVFQRLRQHGLKIKPSKCEFFRPEVRYLGHRVTREGVMPQQDK